MTEIIGMKVIGKAQAMRTMPGSLHGRPRHELRAPKVHVRSTGGQAPAQGADQEVRITISQVDDIVEARQAGARMVQQMGFSGSRITLVTTVISELARNILLYAGAGEIVLSRLGSDARLTVAALDQGPGIDNLPQVMAGGYSTSGGLGLGLCGLRRIADEFKIKTQSGKGTQVLVSIRGS